MVVKKLWNTLSNCYKVNILVSYAPEDININQYPSKYKTKFYFRFLCLAAKLQGNLTLIIS